MAYVRNYMDNISNMNNMNNINMQQYHVMGVRKEALRNSLKLIEKIVDSKKEDEMLYDYLLSKAPTKEEKEIIESIKDDEKKHNIMFRRIYKDFTGRDVRSECKEDSHKSKSYIEGVKGAVFRKLKAIEACRKIRQGLPYTLYRDMLLEIMTDEIQHAVKCNYILSLKCQHKKYKECKGDCSKKDHKEYKEYKGEIKKKFTKKVNRITEAGGNALDKAKEKFKEENLLQEVIIPGIMMGVKNVYMVDEIPKETRGKVNIKEDVLVNCLGEVTELALRKVKDKVDIEGFFEQYILPQLIDNE